ncbi:hypothetical protein B481_3254 [Planococcus halocryophilus Or1]|uniref:Uncharacterized protein n=1 Tax=Planococcus halocryophilus TaxID=1215089 RepID=A0A1C7DN32_9BACL|nr:hypothetical protein [Planococcus halocryophilus]ANU12906.1 hypothetical protein BBI08_03175 [Planococcus halocryophilus]EMF45393.1 hypothetical protein B481_3254 [Planococcus halocryophilus Or1]
MGKVYITHELIGSDGEILTCDNIQNLVKFYVTPSTSVNYSDATCEILVDFIFTKALFPIYLTFEPFTGMEEDLENLFQNKNIEYTLRFEGLKNKRFPVFKLTIESSSTLSFVLQETFWIATCNQFYAFSFSDKIMYRTLIGKSWFGRKKTSIWPHFNMNGASTVIEIWYDGDGFNLYTTDPHFSTNTSIIKTEE